MRMIVVGLAGIATLAGGIFFFTKGESPFVFNGSSSNMAATANEALVPAPSLTDEYKNEEFRFSLSTPEDFTVTEIPDDGGGKAIVLQNSIGQGIQILVTPYQDDVRVLTADDVRASIPDMQVSEEQPVEIGAEHTGVAFKSDNEAFEGASREVWFIFRGHLYQISTYARLDPLLRAMFGTWKFF